MILQLDTLDGGNAATLSPQGWEIRRSALVSDIGGAPATRLTRATRCPGLPAIGSPHPGAPGAKLDRIEVASIDTTNDTVRLSLTYRTLNAENGGQVLAGRGGVKILGVEFFGQTQQETTNEDASGQAMISAFRGTWYNQDGTTAPITLLWDEVTAEVFRPQLGVRIRHERAALPRDLAPLYTGAVNSDQWSGFKPRTWLCTSFASDNSSGVWVSTFEALYRPTGWQVTHVIKVDGRALSAAVPGNGIDSFDVYPARPFAALGVAF